MTDGSRCIRALAAWKATLGETKIPQTLTQEWRPLPGSVLPYADCSHLAPQSSTHCEYFCSSNTQ